MLKKIIGGSYPSGPSNAEPPLIWQMILKEEVAAWNVPSGIVFDMLREGAAKRPGVLTKVGIDTFVDPEQEGCAMNAAARSEPIVRRVRFADDDWLHFPPIQPDVAIIRATTADERGNLTFEHEGATLGAMEMALAARNSGGIVIAQVKRVAPRERCVLTTCAFRGYSSTSSSKRPINCRRLRPRTILRYPGNCSARFIPSARRRWTPAR